MSKMQTYILSVVNAIW